MVDKNVTPAKRAGRPAGARNPDYASSRDALLDAAFARLVAPGGARPSFRELAAAAGVSVPTLRHYFPTRESLLAATLSRAKQQGLPFLHVVAAGPLPASLAESMRWFVEFLTAGLAQGVASLHVLSLTEGLGEPVVGPAYVDFILEPTLQALEARLERHIARGDMHPTNVRHAALMLVSPLLLAYLHQGPLGGAACRPLDQPAFAAALLESFASRYACDAHAVQR